MARRRIKAREHVRDTFARVLERSCDVRRSDGVDSNSAFMGMGTLHISLRNHHYRLEVGASDRQITVMVSREGEEIETDTPSFIFPGVFFQYSCPLAHMSKLRKAALVLLKKLENREVFDVMKS